MVHRRPNAWNIFTSSHHSNSEGAMWYVAVHRRAVNATTIKCILSLFVVTCSPSDSRRKRRNNPSPWSFATHTRTQCKHQTECTCRMFHRIRTFRIYIIIKEKKNLLLSRSDRLHTVEHSRNATLSTNEMDTWSSAHRKYVHIKLKRFTHMAFTPRLKSRSESTKGEKRNSCY